LAWQGTLPRAHGRAGSLGGRAGLQRGRRQDKEPVLRHARHARQPAVQRRQARAGGRLSPVEGLPQQAAGSGRAQRASKPAPSVARVKIVTWNVNGVRARQAELQQLLATEQPDVVCLQEIKAAPDQVPALLLAPEGYWCYWHGAKGYSGVALLVRCGTRAESPGFSHPAFDLEQRIVVPDFGATEVALVYVPNGGKDFDVKLRFLESLADWTAETSRSGQALVICGDLNVAREDRDVHPKERKPNQIGTRPEERALLGRLV